MVSMRWGMGVLKLKDFFVQRMYGEPTVMSKKFTATLQTQNFEKT